MHLNQLKCLAGFNDKALLDILADTVREDVDNNICDCPTIARTKCQETLVSGWYVCTKGIRDPYPVRDAPKIVYGLECVQDAVNGTRRTNQEKRRTETLGLKYGKP